MENEGEQQREPPIVQLLRMVKAAPQAIKRIEEAIAVIEATRQKIASHLGTIANTNSARDGLIKTGWLPHWYVPREILAPNADIPIIMSEWSANAWPECAATLLTDLEKYKLPGSAKSALATAIDLHATEKYNLVPRILFPEIELCARQLFYSKKGMKGLEVATRLKELTEDMEPMWLLAAVSGILVPERALLGAHMPVVKQFVYGRSKRGQPPPFHSAFPNRNLVLHGEATYDTPQASINMMFITDVMFRGISISHHQPHLSMIAKAMSAPSKTQPPPPMTHGLAPGPNLNRPPGPPPGDPPGINPAKPPPRGGQAGLVSLQPARARFFG
jgi:hypothetical protein